jgi:copper transport protein
MGKRVRCLLLVLAAALIPATAFAHVKLDRSDPGAGSILTATPLEMKFWFSETPEIAVTRFVLTDAAGKVVGLADPLPVEGNPNQLRVQLLNPLAAGVYKLTWKTVGLDGHPAQGDFSFRVLGATESVDTAFAAEANRVKQDSAAAAKSAEEAAKPADVLDRRSAAPEYVLARALSVIALLALMGAVIFRQGVLMPTAENDPATWKKIGDRVAKLASLAALVYVVMALVRLYLQTRLISGNEVPDIGDLQSTVRRTNWGGYWRLQVIAAAIAGFALLLARPLKGKAWVIAAGAALTAIIATSLASHAGATEDGRVVGVLADSIHMLAVSAWLGGLFWLVVAVLPLITPGERHSRRASTVVNAFSRIAVASVALVMLTGVVSAWLRVGSLDALVQSAYGQVLLAKLLAVMAVGGVGFYNWRKLRPTMDMDGSIGRLRKSGRTELVAALFVIVATATLVALPLPSPQ